MSGAALTSLPIVVPMLGACVLLAVGKYLPRPLVNGWAIAVAVAGLATDIALLAHTAGGRTVAWSGGWSPHAGSTVGIALIADPFGAGMAVIGGVTVTAALLFSWRYFDTVEAYYPTMLLLFLTGFTGFALSGDLFDMLVFFELLGAMGYALTAVKIEDEQALQGGINFAIVNSLGAYFTLVGIALLYARTGLLGLPQLSAALAAGHHSPVLLGTCFVLICAGWLVKASAVPFHFWTADAEATAPSPVCAVFSAAMVELGVYGVARVYWVVFRRAIPAANVHLALTCLGVLTAVIGAVMCLAQRDLKRLLAYSTIAHVGLFLLAVAQLSTDGLTGAALYVAAHAGIKGSLFLVAGIVLNRFGSVDEARLFGKGRDSLLLGTLMILDALALAGLPPFGTGLGKAVSEEAIGPLGTVLFVAVSAATGGAVLRSSARIFFGLGGRPAEDRDEDVSDEDETESQQPLHRLPVLMVSTAAGLGALGLAVGVVPGLPDAFALGAHRFTDPGGYVASALHGAASVPVHAVTTGWTGAGVVLDLLSAALAVGVAALALFAGRLPAAVRAAARGPRAAIGRLQRLHSGHIGDYVTWQMVGLAALIALIARPG